MFRRHTPKPRKRQRRSHFSKMKIGSLITFAAKSEDGVWPGVHSAARTPREMNSETREPRIRHWINEPVHQRCALRNQVVVFAAKGNDHYLRIVACHARNAI